MAGNLIKMIDIMFTWHGSFSEINASLEYIFFSIEIEVQEENLEENIWI
jgi:hypothetical protein